MGLAVETSAECSCPEAPAGAFGRPAARQRTWAGRASDRTPFFARHYDWDGPERVGKTVTEGGVTTSQTQMEYDVAGRLSKVTITTYTSGQASSVVTQEFTYDTDGIKVTQTETVDSGADGTADSTTSTEYLNDKGNHTGYSQVIEERVNDGTQTRTTTYTIGHDVIAQFSAAVGALVLLTDAHGSTRAVADAGADVQQEYLYDAYGTLLNMQPANALTSLLYSGEQFNPVAGLQYLRARWYDPSIGRFTRMDPYSGNVQDPLGLHKYTYANGNPVMGWDPTGEMTLVEVTFSMALQAALIGGLANGVLDAAIGNDAVPWKTRFVMGMLSGFVGTYIGCMLSAVAPELAPFWISFASSGLTSAIDRVCEVLLDPRLLANFNGQEAAVIVTWAFVDAFVGGFLAVGLGKIAPKLFSRRGLPNWKPSNPRGFVITRDMRYKVRTLGFRWIGYGTITKNQLLTTSILDWVGAPLWAFVRNVIALGDPDLLRGTAMSGEFPTSNVGYV